MADNFIQNVGIYHLDNKLYVVPLVRVPPLGLSREVEPIFTVDENDRYELARAIEFARVKSGAQYNPGGIQVEQRKWNGERVRNVSSKAWDILWDDKGVITLSTARPYQRIGNSVEWKFEGKQILEPSMSSESLAETIIKLTNA